MKRTRTMSRAIIWVLLGLLLLTGVVSAQEGYDLSWWTVDAGGYTFSSGGGYLLGGTAGQPDAGLLEGEGYRLGGGFWSGVPALWRIYLPLVLRQAP
jgi:hypothetical protein